MDVSQISVNYQLGFFPFLVVMNNAAINICIQVFMWTCFHSLGYNIPRSGISRSSDNAMFNFLTNCHTAFQNGSTILHSPQK